MNHWEDDILPLKLDIDSANEEWECREAFVQKVNFLKINKRGDPNKVRGVGKKCKNQ